MNGEHFKQEAADPRQFRGPRGTVRSTPAAGRARWLAQVVRDGEDGRHAGCVGAVCQTCGAIDRFRGYMSAMWFFRFGDNRIGPIHRHPAVEHEAAMASPLRLCEVCRRPVPRDRERHASCWLCADCEERARAAHPAGPLRNLVHSVHHWRWAALQECLNADGRAPDWAGPVAVPWPREPERRDPEVRAAVERILSLSGGSRA